MLTPRLSRPENNESREVSRRATAACRSMYAVVYVVKKRRAARSRTGREREERLLLSPLGRLERAEPDPPKLVCPLAVGLQKRPAPEPAVRLWRGRTVTKEVDVRIGQGESAKAGTALANVRVQRIECRQG